MINNLALLFFFNFFLLLFCSLLESKDRRPSYPYITGDAFRAFADYVYDEDGCNIDLQSLKESDVIFVKTECCEDFFRRIHPRIPHKYILITHNSDLDIPGPWAHFLDDDKLLVWFGQNICDFNHPKLKPLPIGLTNRYNPFGEVIVFEQAVKRAKKGINKRKTLAYFNVSIETCLLERRKAYEVFLDKVFCKTISQFVPFKNYLRNVLSAKFVISPRGNGLDCHRTWEALYLGAIPVVKHSEIDSLFEGLPVLIIDRWEEVTKDLLVEKYQEFSDKTFDFSKLCMNYWIDQISSFKNL